MQAVTERESGGKPSNRHTYLEHRWNFNIGSGASATVFANAWRSGSNSSESFDIEYSTNGGSTFAYLMNVSSTSSDNLQSAEIPGAPSGSVILRVRDTHQQSGDRNKSTFHVDHLYIQVGNPPSGPPAAPTGMSASAVSTSAINLSWTDASNNESGFTLQRSLDGSSNWVGIADLGVGMESHGDHGLEAATQYFYRLRAWNGDGVSDWVYANATTHMPPPAPMAPGNMQASAVSASQINLSWVDSGPNEDGFRVERSPTGQADSWSTVATLGADSTSHQDGELQAATTYFYRVVAFHVSGEAASDTDSATTDAEPAISLQASGSKVRGKHRISLNWEGADRVDVYRDGSVIAPDYSGSSYVDDTGQNGGRTYTHQVCHAGTSTCSNTTTTVF